MTVRQTWRRLVSALLPWPTRAERKAAIADARTARERARALAAHAERTAAEIKRIAYQDNHFASNIIATLRSQGGEGSDPGPARRRPH